MKTLPVVELSGGKSVTLDLIRIIAAQLVLWVHLLEWTVVPYSADGALRFMIPIGYLAVMCFFVLSGLLIARSIIASSSSPRGYDFRTYLLQRLARLWPTLLAALVVTLAAFLIIKCLGIFGSDGYEIPDHDYHFPRKDAHLKASTFAATGLFMNGMIGVEGFNLGTVGMNGPLWSLAHEFWFYVLAGLVASWMFNRSRVALLAAVSILMWQCLTSNNRWLLGLVVWSLGAASAVYLHGKQPKVAAGSAMFLAGGAILVWKVICPDAAGLPMASRLALGVAAVLLVLGSLRARLNFSDRNARRISVLARYTFTLYAVHWPLIQLSVGFAGPEFHRLPPAAVAFALFCLAIVINICAFYLSKFCEDTPRWRRAFGLAASSPKNP